MLKYIAIENICKQLHKLWNLSYLAKVWKYNISMNMKEEKYEKLAYNSANPNTLTFESLLLSLEIVY